MKPLATLLRQGINNQSGKSTYKSKVAKSKCKMPAKVHVLPTMNSLPPNATCCIPQYQNTKQDRTFPNKGVGKTGGTSFLGKVTLLSKCLEDIMGVYSILYPIKQLP